MLSVVLPTYNESENIKKLVPRIFETLKKSHLDGRVIIVDDNSPDGTAKTAGQLSGKYDITIIKRKKKQGLGTAYVAGFKKALELGTTYAFSMDADLQHPPEKIPEFVETMEKTKADVVIGSRYVKGGGSCLTGWRFLASKCGGIVSKIILGLPVNDPTAGYKCYRASAISAIDLDSIKAEGYGFQEEILFALSQNGFRLAEIPIYFDYRANGESKLGPKEVPEFLANIVRMKFRHPRKAK